MSSPASVQSDTEVLLLSHQLC